MLTVTDESCPFTANQNRKTGTKTEGLSIGCLTES